MRLFLALVIWCVCLLIPLFGTTIGQEWERVAFDAHELTFWGLSPDGKYCTYSVKHKPTNQSLYYGSASDGTPTEAIGCKIFVRRLDSGEMIEINTSRGDCWQPSWSKDGKKIAFYSNEGGRPELWLYTFSTGSSKKLCDLPVKSSYVFDDAVHWSPDNKTIYVPFTTTAKVQPEVAEDAVTVSLYDHEWRDDGEQVAKITSLDTESLLDFYPTFLAAVDTETGSSHVVVSENAPHPPGFCKLSASGIWLSYLSPQVDLPSDTLERLYDLVLAKCSEKDQVLRIVQDVVTVTETTNYIWNPVRDELVYVKDKKLYLVAFDQNGPMPVKELNVGQELTITPLVYTQDGSAVLLGTVSSILALVPVDGQNPAEFFDITPWSYLDIVKTAQNVLWQPQKKTIVASLKDWSSGKTVMATVSLEKTANIRLLWQGKAYMSDFVATPQGDIFCYYEDFQTPSDIYRYTPDFSSRKRISTVDPKLEKLPLPTYKVLETVVPLYNGELSKVRTTILLPPGADLTKPLPAIVVFYPGSYVSRQVDEFCGGSVVTIPNFLFLNHGYAVILPDVPLVPWGKAGNPLQEIVDVILAQVYRAANLGYVDINHLGIIGQSYGGYGTAGVISKTNLFRAAVGISGVYDLPGNYGTMDKEDLFSQRWLEYSQGRMGSSPWANMWRYLSNSPYYLADTIRTPLFLVHGEADQTCWVEESEKMFMALKRLNREVHLALYSDEDHVLDFWRRANAIDASKRILDFLDKHCK